MDIQKEMQLDDLYIEVDIRDLDEIISKKIKDLLIKYEYISVDNNNIIKIVPGSISSNFKEGYYDGSFSVSEPKSLKMEMKGTFSSDVRLRDANKIEILGICALMDSPAY